MMAEISLLPRSGSDHKTGSPSLVNSFLMKITWHIGCRGHFAFMADAGDSDSNACSVSRNKLGSGPGKEGGDVAEGPLTASRDTGPVPQDHTSHSALPSSDVLEEKKRIDVHLKNLKMDLMEELKGFQDEESLQAAELELKVQHQRDRIICEFEELRLYLEKEKMRVLSRLEGEKEEILKMRLEKAVQLEEKRSSVQRLITGMEEKHPQPGVDLEKDMQRALRRFQTLKDMKQRLGSKEQAKILRYFGEESAEIQESIIESLEWRRCCLFADGVVLDPDSAHPNLSLSEDRRSVIMGSAALGLPDSPERFDAPCVLGFPRLTSGIHYWEVEVGEMREWILGVCYESVRRKGVFEPSPENGVWAVGLWDGYRALTTAYPGTPLSPRQRPRVVGVFLNFEAGSLTFYNVGDRCQLVTFPPTSFSQPLRPYFCTWDTVTPLRVHMIEK
ncbi:E3 ubiquitin-protein ligase TRIM39-like [Lissotriton helveticus]